jgi:hypothetical protein
MQTSTPFRKVPSALVLSLFGAAMLAACGGGGDAGNTLGIDDATAMAYSANATLINSDASSVADTAVLTAQSVVASGGLAASVDGRSGVMSASASPLVAAPTSHACAGGGTATVTVTGGTPASLLNGQLDAGEVYDVTFAGCMGAAGAAAVDGSLSMTVVTATGDSSNGTLALDLTATNLAVTFPRGSATLNGSSSRSVTVSTDTDGTFHVSSHFTTPSLTLATHYNARSSTFTLSAVDVLRNATFLGGVLQSSSISGTHTLSATLPRGAFTYTVTTTGSATYAADGTPTSGSWTITLPQNLIGVTIANGIATITIDHGKDGTIDRTITIPVPQLVTDAG